jgi:glucose/arabinose dehydrogenase
VRKKSAHFMIDRRFRVRAGFLVCALFAGLPAVSVTPLAVAAVALPSGFVLQDMATGLRPPVGSDPGDLLTDFTFLPDESILVSGKHGKVMWVPRTGAPREIANLPTRFFGDLGLAGLAVAPDYTTSHTIYTARSMPLAEPGGGPNGLLRLSAWQVNTDAAGAPVGLATERVVVQTIAVSHYHALTGIVAAEDGTLWVSIGDSSDAAVVDTRALGALNLDDLHGKLLHIRPDGSGVAANPYFNPVSPRSARSLIYASGFRSPFRVSLDPGSGRPVVADVGWNAWEEVNIVNPGSSYGWPCWEGNEPTPGYRDLPQCAGSTTTSPLYAYRHVGTSSITGGVVYRGTSYPQQYRNRYFFADYVDRQLFTLAYNSRGELTQPPEPGGFGNDIGAPVKIAAMPSGGDIIFADILSAKLRRLVYAPGNNPPVPVVTTSVNPDTRTVTFDARESSDPNGDPLAYRWSFGDGTSASGALVAHTYPSSPASFTATLTATDPLGASAMASTTVYPSNHAPTLTLNGPPDGQTFAVGDVISAGATATDAEDGALPVTWATVLVHCSAGTNCHNHPGAGQSGPNFWMTFEGHAGDTRLEITAIATDSRGATTTATFVARPRQRRVTILSNSPANFTIGDQTTSSGLFTVGMTLPLIAPAAAVDGVATFDRWADGSTDRVRQLVLPDADQTLSVSYLTPIDRRYATDANLRAIVGTPVDVEQGNSVVRWRAYSAGRVYWSPASGVHEVHGPIMTTYLRLGGHNWFSVVPLTDQLSTSDGVGRYNDFTVGVSIYWSQATGAHEVYGSIRTTWTVLGRERSYVGYPTTGELGTADGTGRANFFQRGAIYWSLATGAHEVQGAIYGRWAALGYQASYLGYPTSGELNTADGTGKASFFQRGAIYWSPGTGAWEIQGSIYGRWAALGYQASYLGYPTSGEFDIPGGRRSNFQHGFITWNATTGQTIDRRY